MTNIHAKQGLQTVGGFGVRRPRTGRGAGSIPLPRQVAVLYCAAWGVPESHAPLLVKGAGVEAVAVVCQGWRCVLRDYVSQAQDEVVEDIVWSFA